MEDQARQQNLDAADRLALRRGKSIVLMEKLKIKIVDIRQRILPKRAWRATPATTR
jgi:hypothetical protein